MKVIAIVNLPFDVDLDREDAFFVMRDGKYCQNVHLRPLPQKKETRNAIQYRGLAEEYRKEGWNECLDEITGEK